MSRRSISVSAPAKIHLLGEHAVVYGKPAILATINLRVTVTIQPCHSGERQRLQNPTGQARITEIIEPIIRKYLKLKSIPPYNITISSQIPIGAGLGSSASLSAAYIAALLAFLRVRWDKNLINQLTYEAEKIFHGHPSGGDNATVVFGGLLWFRKETEDIKLIQPIPFTIPSKLARNFVIINTGKPQESTREMIEIVSAKCKVQSAKFKRIFDRQEELVKNLPAVLKTGDEKEFIRIIREGEKNLEIMGVASKLIQPLIRQIETAGGAAKICGGGGKTGPTGVLLVVHKDKKVVVNIAKTYNLPYFSTALGVEGVRKEE